MTSDEVAAALDRAVAGLPGGGEVREGQQSMAEGVGRAFEGGRHLVVRAGTGTGKSLAYLVPAILSGRRVVVATATKALQDQLARKDLPNLAATLDRPFEFAVLKGRSNYLCAQRLFEADVNGHQAELGSEVDGGTDLPRGRRGEQVRQIVQWARSTASGDRAELDLEPDPAVWSAFSVSAEECPGAFRCPSGGGCFAEAARTKAASADVIVINLHLLGAHLAAGAVVLPEHDALVIDEAHELEEVMSKSLGVSIGAGRLRALAATARSAAPRSRRQDFAAGRLEEASTAIFDVAERFESALSARVGERLRAGVGGELGEIIELIVARLERLEAALRSAIADAASNDSGDEPRVQRTLLSTGRLRGQLGRLAELSDDEVAWIESGTRPTLEIAPIDVAPVLSEQLFSKMPVILTSATVPPLLAARLGAEPAKTDHLDVGSPFAFEEHALLYCAAHLPDRRRPESEAAVHSELVALITAAGGRTLALFTSRSAMERAAVVARGALSFPILVQGEGSKAALLESFFAADAPTCLFATMGFWQGVDVPGATLSLVVIDRIPFARPDDPLIAARRERAGAAAFRHVDLPRAASLLAQGAGRLVRGMDDRGVVAVLDSRLATASYRWDLVRALPPMRRTKDRVEAEAYLRQRNADATARLGQSA